MYMISMNYLSKNKNNFNSENNSFKSAKKKLGL
jgi:hypothetical protein